jgi:hypothetical protein
MQVVTVPAHFNERQLGATRQAACLAGLPESQVQLLQGAGSQCTPLITNRLVGLGHGQLL